jgi:hypothetical protein
MGFSASSRGRRCEISDMLGFLRVREARRSEKMVNALSSKLRWWVMTDSNRRHPRCKRGALPAELITRMSGEVVGDERFELPTSSM